MARSLSRRRIHVSLARRNGLLSFPPSACLVNRWEQISDCVLPSRCRTPPSARPPACPQCTRCNRTPPGGFRKGIISTPSPGPPCYRNIATIPVKAFSFVRIYGAASLAPASRWILSGQIRGPGPGADGHDRR